MHRPFRGTGLMVVLPVRAGGVPSRCWFCAG